MPTKASPLSDIQIRNFKPKAEDYKKYDGGNLYLLIKTSGSKLWKMDFTHNGKRGTLSFGAYPATSLSQARAHRSNAQTLLAQGINPNQEKRAQAAAQEKNKSNTFEKFARSWHAEKAKTCSENNANKIIKALEKNVFPFIGNMPVNEIQFSDMISLLNKMKARGATSFAARVKAMCSNVFNYASIHLNTDINPTRALGNLFTEPKNKNHSRVSSSELPQLMQNIENYSGIRKLTRLALLFLAHTFVRTGELRNAEWSEVITEQAQWIIPGHKMKMGQTHIVPLSTQVISILEELRSISGEGKYIFPSERTPQRTMSENTILYALYSMGYRGRMTGHGFRGVASTILHENEYPSEWIETQLAHGDQNKIRAAYNHAKYIPQRTEMMQYWSDYLENQCKKICT